MQQYVLDAILKLLNMDKKIDVIGKDVQEIKNEIECLSNKLDTEETTNYPDTNREYTFKFKGDKDWKPMATACWSGCPFSFLIPLGKSCRCINGEYPCPFINDDKYTFYQEKEHDRLSI